MLSGHIYNVVKKLAFKSFLASAHLAPNSDTLDVLLVRLRSALNTIYTKFKIFTIFPTLYSLF